MPRVTHFEFHAQDPEKLGDFYHQVFGWHIQKKWVGKVDYWLIHTGLSDEKGIHGGIRQKAFSTSAPIPTIDVNDFDLYAEKIIASGGKLVTPKLAVTGTGYLAYCQDVEGNYFTLLEKDPSTR